MITSTSNPQIKQVVNLQAKGKVRSELGLFVVEGRKMVEEVPESLCRKVFVSESYLESQKNRNFFDKFQVETVPDVVFRHMSDTKTPQGILAVVQQQKYMLEDLMTGGPVLVLEGILESPESWRTDRRWTVIIQRWFVLRWVRSTVSLMW